MGGTTQDADFQRDTHETFCAECEEHIESATTALLRLEKAGKAWHETPKLQRQFFKDLETLKEAAGTLKIKDFEGVLELLETTLSPLHEKKGMDLSEADYQLLYEVIDLINELILIKPKEKGRKPLCNRIQKLLSEIKPKKQS